MPSAVTTTTVTTAAAVCPTCNAPAAAPAVAAPLLPPLPTPLTAAETRVVALVAEGCSNREIAARLFVSVATVESHLKHAFTKAGVSSRLQLALLVRGGAA